MNAHTSCAEAFARIRADLAREFGATSDAAPPGLHEPSVIDLDVEGTALAVIYSPLENPLQIAVVCTLGQLPASNQTAVLRRLMELSFFLAGSDASVGMSPAREDVLMTLHAPLATATAQTLARSFRMQARLAQEWRDHYFLGARDSTAAAANDVFAEFWKRP